MCEAKDFPSSERDDLMGLVTQLQGQVAQLTAANEELHKQVAELKRAGKREAAPFSKGGRSSRPKRPGRKPGMGSFSYRKSPSPDEVTEPLVEVAVAEDTCPGCGGRLEHEGVRVVYATDIPPIPRPQVTGYRVQICRCRSCGKQVRGRHPDVAPDQYGASAHRVGRRVMAAAHVLHYGVGVPVRKVPAVLRALTGVELSQGAISQDALRRARGTVGDAYHKLRGSVRASPLVHTDDTGWRVDGGPAFLMAFETDEATVYQVRARHRNEEVREVAPSDYGGVMVTDRGRSYDAQALSGVKQQKCLAHVLRSISEVVQTKRGRGRSFGNRLSRLLREAMELRQAYHRGEAADFAAEAERLRREATYHLRDRPMSDADNWRLQNELGWHDDRGNLLRFLDDPSIEPTNNRAERALRPAVIARKVSHCSKNVGGADAFSAFTSVIRTLARNGGDHSLVKRALRCVQRCSGPRPFLLNPSSHSAPLINYEETNASPSASASATWTPVGSPGPLFVTVTVNLTSQSSLSSPVVAKLISAAVVVAVVIVVREAQDLDVLRYGEVGLRHYLDDHRSR